MVRLKEEEELSEVLTSTFPTVRLPSRPTSQHAFPVYVDIIGRRDGSIVGARATSSSLGEHASNRGLVNAWYLSIPRHLEDFKYIVVTINQSASAISGLVLCLLCPRLEDIRG